MEQRNQNGKVKKLMEWIRKYWLISILLASIFYSLLVHVLFKLSSPIGFFVSNWSAGDALTYGGSIIGAIATIYVFQETLNTNGEIQKEERSFSLRPYFVISVKTDDELAGIDPTADITNHSVIDAWNGNINVYLEIQNVGAGNAVNVKAKINQPSTTNHQYETDKISALIVGQRCYFLVGKCQAGNLNILFEYEDIASISKYVCECSIEIKSKPGVVAVACSVPKITKNT